MTNEPVEKHLTQEEIDKQVAEIDGVKILFDKLVSSFRIQEEYVHYIDEIQKYYDLVKQIKEREAFLKNDCKEPSKPKAKNEKSAAAASG